MPGAKGRYRSFYHKSAVTALEPSYVSYPGQLRIRRLLDGKAKAFYIPGEDKLKEKKVVVLSDWSLTHKSSKFHDSYKFAENLIANLLWSDFVVYYWTADGLQQIERQQLSNFSGYERLQKQLFVPN